jgi:hypothetical protein
VKWDKQSWPCWVSAYVVEVDGDPFSVVEYYHPLPKSSLYGPVKRISAEREGDQVTITWADINMTEDDNRGYLILADICQNGLHFELPIHTMGESITITDEDGCSTPSSGVIYGVEKHGYTDPVEIPWP